MRIGTIDISDDEIAEILLEAMISPNPDDIPPPHDCGIEKALLLPTRYTEGYPITREAYMRPFCDECRQAVLAHLHARKAERTMSLDEDEAKDAIGETYLMVHDREKRRLWFNGTSKPVSRMRRRSMRQTGYNVASYDDPLDGNDDEDDPYSLYGDFQTMDTALDQVVDDRIEDTVHHDRQQEEGEVCADGMSSEQVRERRAMLLSAQTFMADLRRKQPRRYEAFSLYVAGVPGPEAAAKMGIAMCTYRDHIYSVDRMLQDAGCDPRTPGTGYRMLRAMLHPERLLNPAIAMALEATDEMARMDYARTARPVELRQDGIRLRMTVKAVPENAVTP